MGVFGLNPFSQPNKRLSHKACHLYLESLYISGQFGVSRTNFSASYGAADFCWQIATTSLQDLRPCHTKICVKKLCTKIDLRLVYQMVKNTHQLTNSICLSYFLSFSLFISFFYFLVVLVLVLSVVDL